MRETTVGPTEDILCPHCEKRVIHHESNDRKVNPCKHFFFEFGSDEGDDQNMSGADHLVHVEQGAPSGERFLSVAFRK